MPAGLESANLVPDRAVWVGRAGDGYWILRRCRDLWPGSLHLAAMKKGSGRLRKAPKRPSSFFAPDNYYRDRLAAVLESMGYRVMRVG